MFRLKKHVVLIGCLASSCLALAYMVHAEGKHDRAGKVGDLAGYPKEEQVYFKEDPDYFKKKSAPGPYDWLASHKEAGQTFGQYLESGANKPDKKRRVLYVLPLGEFGENAPSLKVLKEYMEAYYGPLAIKVMDPVEVKEVVCKKRINYGVEQWKSTDIIKWMKPKLPDDAYAMLAITMTDLYPGEKWNFVFGQASLQDRVGVFSFARYGSKDKNLALLRAGKVLTHEMGHMFGIKHCIYYQCNMNGANHLVEVDSTPPHLCPVCLRKVHDAVGFDISERYQKLQGYYQKQGNKKAAEWSTKRRLMVKWFI